MRKYVVRQYSSRFAVHDDHSMSFEEWEFNSSDEAVKHMGKLNKLNGKVELYIKEMKYGRGNHHNQ